MNAWYWCWAYPYRLRSQTVRQDSRENADLDDCFLDDFVRLDRFYGLAVRLYGRRTQPIVEILPVAFILAEPIAALCSIDLCRDWSALDTTQ